MPSRSWPVERMGQAARAAHVDHELARLADEWDMDVEELRAEARRVAARSPESEAWDVFRANEAATHGGEPDFWQRRGGWR